MIEQKNDFLPHTLVQDKDVAWEELGGGLRRKVMAYNNALMLVKVDFEKGSIGTLHHHPHLQISYVASGSFETSIGENVKILNAGDVYCVPANVIHGVICLEKGQLIDIFSPLREDFL
jgi:quercetin dioxygenase-like cupin family protein